MPGPDQVDYSAIAGAIFVAIAVVAVGFTIWFRDWRRRLRQFERAAATARRDYRPDASDPIKGVAGETIRMTLLVDVNEIGEIEKAEAWLGAHRDRLTYVSDEGGCGCCVIDWDLTGPREVIETLPNSLRCDSPWTRRER